METTTGSTYVHPSLNGPIEPLNRQFFKRQRWNVVQDTNIEKGDNIEYFHNEPIHELNLYRTGTNPSGLFNYCNLFFQKKLIFQFGKKNFK